MASQISSNVVEARQLPPGIRNKAMKEPSYECGTLLLVSF